MFEGPKLKIKRAKKHIGELIDVLAEYTNSGFYNWFIKEHPKQPGL